IRHVPVVSERGRLVGMLEDSDLYAAQPRSWVRARRNIERARNLDALSEAAGQLPTLMLDLHHSSVPALELAPVLSALVHALTRPPMELVSANGAATEPGVVWVSLGRQARRELTPASTRRGAVIHDPELPPSAEWLAEIETALTRCGIVGPLVARDA